MQLPGDLVTRTGKNGKKSESLLLKLGILLLKPILHKRSQAIVFGADPPRGA